MGQHWTTYLLTLFATHRHPHTTDQRLPDSAKCEKKKEISPDSSTVVDLREEDGVLPDAGVEEESLSCHGVSEPYRPLS